MSQQRAGAAQGGRAWGNGGGGEVGGRSIFRERGWRHVCHGATTRKLVSPTVSRAIVGSCQATVTMTHAAALSHGRGAVGLGDGGGANDRAGEPEAGHHNECLGRHAASDLAAHPAGGLAPPGPAMHWAASWVSAPAMGGCGSWARHTAAAGPRGQRPPDADPQSGGGPEPPGAQNPKTCRNALRASAAPCAASRPWHTGAQATWAATATTMQARVELRSALRWMGEVEGSLLCPRGAAGWMQSLAVRGMPPCCLLTSPRQSSASLSLQSLWRGQPGSSCLVGAMPPCRCPLPRHVHASWWWAHGALTTMAQSGCMQCCPASCLLDLNGPSPLCG